MKIKRESLETIIAMHKNICNDKDIRTMTRVVAIFGLSIKDDKDGAALRTVTAYATDGVIMARRELDESKAYDSTDNGLCEALSSTPLFVLDHHVKSVEGLLRAFKHAREFDVNFVSTIAGDLATQCVVSVQGPQSMQVELGARGKVEGSFFEYVKREHLDSLCEFKGATATNNMRHETLVLEDNNSPLLGFNAFLLVDLIKALGGSSKDGGCQITLLEPQSMHKDGKTVVTSKIRVTRPNSKDIGVLCGMRM